MKVAILDANKERRNEISEFFSEYMNVRPCLSGEVDALERQFDTVAVFAYVDSMADLASACRYHELHPDAPMVFVSASDAYALEGHRYGALDYLLWPNAAERVREALWRCESYLSDFGFSGASSHYRKRFLKPEG